MRNHLEPLDGRTYCYIGTQDTHFGQGGLTRVTVPYSTEHANGESASTNKPTILLVDANGRSIIASKTNSTLTLRRVDAFGVTDDAFAASAAGQPMVSFDQTNTKRDDIAIDSTNRIYVLLGTTVTRYRSNGAIDRSFGDKGRARLSTLIRAADLDVGADGHVWVVGTTAAPINDPDKMQVIRLTADGKLDTKFATNGVFTVPVPHVHADDYNASAQGEVVHGMADGSVIFAGRGEYLTKDSGATFYYHAIESVRLDKLGRLVKTYGHRGIVTSSYIYNDAVTESDPQAVGIRSDGTVFICDSFGTDNPDPDNASGESTGIVAPSGSTGGLSNPGISTLIHGDFFDAPDGGSYFVNSQGLSKLSADGRVYAAFNNGKVIGSITAAAIGNNGELVVADTGRTQFDRYYNVARYFVGAGPAATLVPAVLTKSVKSVAFTVFYDDPDGVNIGSLGNRDLVITGPSTGVPATLVSSRRDEATGRVVATYAFTASNGKFTAANNGLYTVSLTGSRLGVSDVNGNHDSGSRIGTIVVNIA